MPIAHCPKGMGVGTILAIPGPWRVGKTPSWDQGWLEGGDGENPLYNFPNRVVLYSNSITNSIRTGGRGYWG